MSGLEQLLCRFHGAILEGRAAPVAGALAHSGRISPEAQMQIYIDGYRLRLIAAIRSDYPETRALMGEEAFERMALAYIHATPPKEASLDVYPFGFAAHVKGGMAAAMAALESAIARVFLLPDSRALEAAGLAALSPEAFGAATLRLRKASALMAFDFPVADYFAARRRGETPEPQEAAASYLMVVRHDNEVRRHALSPVAYALLSGLAEGVSVNDAIGRASQSTNDAPAELADQLQSWFSAWVAQGFFDSMEEDGL